MDACAHPDLVSIQYPARPQWQGMAGAADGQSRAALPQARQLLCLASGRARELLEGQLQTDWAQLLGGFAKQLNPIQESVFERYPNDYYWTTFQSEWATDVVFKEADFLRRLMPLLVRHGMLSFASPDVLRYLGRKVNQSGAIPANFNGTVQVDMKRRQEGERV